MRLAAREYCTGCAACRYSCCRSAISMHPDEEGFLRPYIDEKKCISCGKCARNCPILNETHCWTPLRCCAAFVKDAAVRQKSASGGVFAALSRCVLARGGVVVGSAFGTDLVVRHSAITSVDEISRLQGSKYVQSEIGDVYWKMRFAFDEGKVVLFSGTPCQVAAVRLVFPNEKQLITIEVACHGVPSPEMFSRYLRDLEADGHNTIMSFQFKDKSESWSRYSISWLFSDGRWNSCLAGQSAYLLAFSQNLCLRPSCANCQAKEGRSGADITLSDFWGISDVSPEMNDDKGVSAVIINTENGRMLFSQIESMCSVRDVRIEQIVAKNPFLVRSVCVDARSRRKFMESYLEKGIASAYEIAIARPIHIRLFQAIVRRLRCIVGNI